MLQLCDDEFEEHVQEYAPEKRGLYLHGINRNVAHFETWPSDCVQQVASDWGFFPVDYTVLPNIRAVMKYADAQRGSASLRGPFIEGFVVRCRLNDNDVSSFFFKMKYDFPYLMFREWRELTRRIIKSGGADLRTKSNKNDPYSSLTASYVAYVRKKYRKNPGLELWKNIVQQKGIFAIRHEFIDTLVGLEKYDALLATPANRAGTLHRKVLIFTIATPGCGKTMLGTGLARLYKLAHVQNDDFAKKKSKTKKKTKQDVSMKEPAGSVIAEPEHIEYKMSPFYDAIIEKFDDYDIVYADRYVS